MLDALPDYSPDGSRLTFSSNRGAGGDVDVWTMNADGSAAQNMTEPLASTNDRWSSWSPQGDRIVFWFGTAGGLGPDAEILLLAPADGSLLNLTGNATSDIEPDWGPAFDDAGVRRTAPRSRYEGHRSRKARQAARMLAHMGCTGSPVPGDGSGPRLRGAVVAAERELDRVIDRERRRLLGEAVPLHRSEGVAGRGEDPVDQAVRDELFLVDSKGRALGCRGARELSRAVGTALARGDGGEAQEWFVDHVLRRCVGADGERLAEGSGGLVGLVEE
jgi:hypothetical protein